ncbi:MAG: curli assembly protein CsgF [Mariprofundaceae bacterium]|nr:curli assembly protein CsgF [Mariprofundaceae bacterium]
MKRIVFSIAMAFVFSTGSAFAEQQVYVPVNPSFGGSSNNASGLLANANAQNNFKDPAAVNALKKLTPLQQFNQNLQQFVLNRIAASVTANIIGPGGALQPGTISTQDFTIVVAQPAGPGGPLTVTTTDINTGQTTFFQVN